MELIKEIILFILLYSVLLYIITNIVKDRDILDMQIIIVGFLTILVRLVLL